MKLALFICLFSTAKAFSLELQQEYQGVTFFKWKYGNSYILNNFRRNEIISNGSTSSKTITTADFQDVAPDADDIALTTSTFGGIVNGYTIWGGLKRETVFNLLENKAILLALYKLRLIQRKRLVEEEEESLNLIDNFEQVNILSSQIEFIERRYRKIKDR